MRSRGIFYSLFPSPPFSYSLLFFFRFGSPKTFLPTPILFVLSMGHFKGKTRDLRLLLLCKFFPLQTIHECSFFDLFPLLPLSFRELCEGESLLQKLNNSIMNRIPEGEILFIFQSIAEAVAHCHSQNPPIIHRDLKVYYLQNTPFPSSSFI